MSKKQGPKLIDTHCHILPGVDDGPKTLEESLSMLQNAADRGIGRIIATPHFHPRKGDAEPEVILASYRALKQAAAKRAISVRLYLGQEIYYTPELPDWLDERYCFTMNGSNVAMIEFSKKITIEKIFDAVDWMGRRNYRPMLAHIEKYEALRDVREIEELIDMGAYVQMNAGAILKEDGGSVKRLAYQLMDLDLLTFLGTDAHNAISRFDVMQTAYTKISKKFSSMYAGSMMIDNARDIFGLK